MRCKTVFKESVILSDLASELYTYLKNNVEWEEGVRSKKGFTRKAKPLRPGMIPVMDYVIDHALSQMAQYEYEVLFIYLNYYEDGNMWCPNHNHPGTHQLVISLGGTRTLHVAKKEYPMKNGDAIVFGSAIHGVPKDSSKEGRIAIATFMKPRK